MKRVLLVTGGSRGIGAAIARLAAHRGYAVAINYVSRDEEANKLVSELTRRGGEAIAVKADLANESDIVRMFAEVDAKLGPVTDLVNNAGILERQSEVKNISAERIRRIFAVNAIAPMLCSQEAIRRMALSNGGGGGNIVNISSTAVKQGGPFNYVDYAASKGALEVFTLGLAKELAADGIRVNAVRPGMVYTEIHASGGDAHRVDKVKDTIPMKRGGNPDEIAQAALWLLSEEASYCTGSILDVSGGK